jgi:ABC-2 type transport system ATP-binding protein
MNYIEEFCDEIAILNNGKIVLSGELSSIKRSYPRDRLIVRSRDSDRILLDFDGRCQLGIQSDEVIIALSTPKEKGAVMTRLSENYDIDEVRVAEPTLNDIFVEYTGEAVNEAV